MPINKSLQWFIWGGLFLVLFLPLYVSNSMFFPFITGKNFAFRIITELIFGAWIILAFRDVAYRPKKSFILYAIAAFVGVMAVADILSENPFKSFWSNYERMEGLVTLLHFAAYFIVASSVLTVGNLWERFWQTSLGVSVVLSGYGLLQLAGKLDIHQGATRLDATFGNSTYFAVYLLFHIFIAAFLAARHKGDAGMRWVYGAVILLNIFTLYHTATRGAILGLLGGALLSAVLIAFFERQNTILRNGAIGVLTVAILVPALVVGFHNSTWVKESPVLSRFTSISLTESTTKSRFMVWNMALQGFKERPIFGWGQESFNYVFNKYYDPKMYDQEPWFDRAHNVFFDWLIAGGILGLLAYLSLFGLALYYLWRGSVVQFSITEKSILTGLFAGYFFNNLFVFDNLTSYIFFFSVLAYIHSVNAVPWAIWFKDNTPSKPKGKGQEKNNVEISTDAIISPVILVATIVILYVVNYQPMAANLDLISALQRQDNPEVNLTYFKKAIDRGSFGTPEAREQIAMAASRIIGVNVDEGTKGKFVNTAVEELKNQAEKTPNDARYQIFLGSFLNQIGNYDQALIALKKAGELTPKKQQVYFEMVSSYLNKKEYDHAVEVAKIAYDLEPDYDNAQLVYLMTLVYDGKQKEAADLTAHITGSPNGILTDMRLVKAYADTKQYPKAIDILKTLSQEEPDNPQYHLSLAAVYSDAGKRNEAIAELLILETLKPDQKDQWESYIKQIKAGRIP